MNNEDSLKGNKSESIKEIKGNIPTASDVEWIKIGYETIKQAPDLANSIAKDLITLDTTLITVYTGALTFFEIPEKINIFLPLWLSWIFVAIPIILWLLSIHNNVAVYSARVLTFNEDSPEEIRKAIESVTLDKLKSLNKGKIFFFSAIIMAAFIIIAGCGLNQNKSVQFITSKENLPIFESMSIGVNDQTMVTKTLILLEEDDTYYKVHLDNGKTIKFSKNIVEGIIYC